MTAAPLPANSTNLVLDETDYDYWSFTIPANTEITVTVPHDPNVSDIDLQLFTRHHGRLEHTLWLEGHDAVRREVEVLKDGRFRRFVHYHFETDGAPVELSVYDPEDLDVIAISSIDGKPIDRVPIGRVRALLARSR